MMAAETLVQDEDKQDSVSTRPETIRLMVGLWIAVLIAEVIHQILNITIGLIDPSELRANARQGLDTDQAAQVSDTAINATVTLTIIGMGLFGIAIMGVLAWMVQIVRKPGSFAPSARRLLLIFGLYFIFRTMIIFLGEPAGTAVPVALYAFDGTLQILIGVAAALALVFGSRKDSLDWVGDAPAR